MRKITFYHGQFVTRAKTPSLALVLWYGSWTPPMLPSDPEPCKVYLQPVRYPTEGKAFLDLVVAACEREIGQEPPISSVYNVIWEKQCWHILKWMNQHGMIEGLMVEY